MWPARRFRRPPRDDASAPEAGYYYYVTVQVVENGRTVSKQQQRIRWEHASGTLQLFFDDVPVAYDRLRNGGVLGRLVVDPRHTGRAAGPSVTRPRRGGG